MTQFIYILLIAHLLGDFVFQSNKIAIMKSISVKGIGIHVLIVGAIKVVIMGTFYGLRGVFTAICIALIHFCIDYMKFKLGKRIKKIQTLYFFFDQLLHLSILLLASLLWSNPEAKFNIDEGFIIVGIVMIIAYYVLTITVKDIAFDCNWIENKPFFEINERRIDGITALFLVGAMIFNIWFWILIVLVGGFIYTSFQKKMYDYAIKIIGMKYAVFSIYSLLVYQFIVEYIR